VLKSFDEIYCLLKRGKWENDKSCPDIENLILLSEMYNVTLDELIKGNQNLKEKIHIDEDEDFEKENEFGFPIYFASDIISLIRVEFWYNNENRK
jgi:transcriptional regulator with XRE-family HTH domain